MARLLYLTHRMPYPPDKGDKITTFHFLRHLAAHHEVHLGAFVDSEDDWQHVKTLSGYCADMKLVRIEPRRRKLMSARALLGGASISETFHRCAELQAWVDDTLAHRGIEGVLAYCSAMAPYAAAARWAALPRMTHYADVDSQKWQQYADKHAGPVGWVYRREARTLLALERAMSKAYDTTTFVSEADAALYRTLAPESAHKVGVVPNGVDTGYFDPALRHDNPFDPARPAIVFTGAMDYWPNVDAVRWFATEVLPLLRAARPGAEFWIVGSNPAKEVSELQALTGVHVTGRVPDVRPYIQHAACVVAPLRVARGVQNKVLEAYAMGRNVVLARSAAAGLRPAPFIQANTHDEPAALAGAVTQALAAPALFPPARDYVVNHYSWEYAFGLLDAALGLGAWRSHPACNPVEAVA